ncbi:MAG TPA: M14-type cytosolic carboxypeptidase [Planctomycetota bacterium]|nr:M14-type cytosolic carboxypeptidase [Planctomycetota bacterium]
MPITVDCAYPGGNIIVERIDGDRLVVRQDLRDTDQWWFWWNFRVRGAAGRTLRVEFADERGPVGPNGAVLSTDRRDWRWLGGEFDKHGFTAAVPAGADDAYLAFSFPYQLEDWDRFAAALGGRSEVRSAELVRTEKGRSLPVMTIGNPERAARHAIFTCRHHACEAVASYVLEGVIEGLLAPGCDRLRRTTAFSVVPFVDLDGVEAGDQGKARRPHDHNRDYLPEPLYRVTPAVQALVRDLSRRGLALFVDFHCPWMRGPRNESAYLVEPVAPWAAELARFREILKRTPTGEVPYTGRDDIASGVDWNSGTAPTSVRFALDHGGPALRTAFTLEFSYSVTEGAPATPERAREFGRGMAGAFAEYLGD